MKKITLSALAAFAVVGSAIAGPEVVSSKEYKQPCVTPCFRDQEFQLDLFYSYNDASHQGRRTVDEDLFRLPTLTPVNPLAFPAVNPLLTTTAVIPAGSPVLPSVKVDASRNQYFRDGSGGGVGLNYFFARYFGIGVEGNWWDGVQSGFNGSITSRDLVTPSAPVDAAALLAAASLANTSVRLVDPATGTLLLTKTIRNNGNNHGREAAQQVTGSLILRYPFEGTVCWAPYIFGGGGGIFDGQSTGFGHIGLGVEFRVTPYMGFFSDWRWEFTGGGNGNNNDDFRNDSDLRGNLIPVGTVVIVNGTPTVVTTALRNAALNNFRNFDNNKRNDVSVSRIGVRFVF